MSNTPPPQPPNPAALTAPVPPAVQMPLKLCIQPTAGEVITSLRTGISYTIGDRIGEGHFGIVYACTDGWNNDLAVKVLKPLGKPYETIKASAEAEILKLLALRHPNITYIFDAFEFRDAFYIITERCAGPVGTVLGLPNFNAATLVMPIARCLLQSLHFLHTNGIVHQDIHPGNVFASVVKDELQRPSDTLHFKLGDLGIAKLLSEVGVHNTRALWMQPPEFHNPAEFGPMDHRIDIYHVGLLFLQLALSKPLVFTQADILAGKPREVALALPAPLSFALEKALRRHAAVRTPSAMELWRDLHSPASAAPLGPAPNLNLLPPPPTPPNA
jgi:eukaryotic-like serine/threonine-protein kinase